MQLMKKISPGLSTFGGLNVVLSMALLTMRLGGGGRCASESASATDNHVIPASRQTQCMAVARKSSLM